MKELTDFQEKLARNCPDIRILYNEPMAKHTSFRIGGAVEAMAFPKDKEELAQLLKTSRLLDCNPAILGAGTNVLAPDEGMAYKWMMAISLSSLIGVGQAKGR